MSKNKPIKPGSRPTRGRWCDWLQAITTWTSEQRSIAWGKAHVAWQSGSIQAQYAAQSEMKALNEVDSGQFVHGHHCAVRH